MVSELDAADPRQIGPYPLLGRLGAGGMGRVYLGQSAGGRLVAVKVIRAELAEDADFRARFALEIAAARTVSGVFTAAVIDAGIDGPTPWFATAYVAGPSLAHAVQSRGPLPAGTVLALAAGLAEGLSAIHAAGVVHRDLKPANVLLADDGPRVIDFGISRAAEATSLTRSGMVFGSPGFMSPEQAEGRDVGPPSDVFSLGAVIAFAATGRSPFGSGPTPALVYRVVHAQADTSDLPDQIRPLVERCLAKDPGQRPTAAQVLAEAGAAQPWASWLPAGLLSDAAASVFPAAAPPNAGPARNASRHPETQLASPVADPAAGPPADPAAGPPADQAVGQPVGPATVTSARSRRAGMPPVPPQASARETRPQSHGRRRLAWAGIAIGIVASVATAAAILAETTGRPSSAQPLQPAGRVVSPATSAPPSATASPATSSPPSPSMTPSHRSAAPSSPPASPSVSSPAGPPAAPTNVAATASGPYQVQVTWSGNLAQVSGFNVDNGCPIGACGGTDASLVKATGPTTTTQFTVTPGTYQCFRVQAVNDSGTSPWSQSGCTSTPGLTVPGTREWTSTKVTVHAGDRLGITASGQVYIDPAYPVSPAGVQSCIPSRDHPGGPFPAISLYCWSLIGRIGNGAPFEIGTSALVVATSGRLYLGVNDDNFADNSGSWFIRIKIGGLPPPA